MQSQQNVEELFELAFKDDLTGLYNRRYLNKTLVKSLDQDSGNDPYCFLLMDIDFFKEINDTHGHKNGDRALVSVAELLVGCLQGEETAIRYAGDEFVLLLPKTGPDSGLRKANELVEKSRTIQIPVNGEKEFLNLTFSVGVASFPEYGDRWQEIIEKADEALYAAKQKGRDQASFPSEEGEEIRRGNDLSRMFPCPEYIGKHETRSRIMNAIEELMNLESEQPGASQIVSGECGSGKTRLLKEVEKEAEARDLCVLHLKGSEQMQGICYGSLVQGILDRAGTAEQLREQTEDSLTEADKPVLETFFSCSQPAGESVSFPEEVIHGFFSRLLEVLGNGRLLVLLLDDTDLLDQETVNLLESIHRERVHGLRFFALMTFSERQDKTSGQKIGLESPEMKFPSGDLLGTPLPTIRLEPLEEKDVEMMIQAIFPTLRMDPCFSRDLYRQSRGNPLFLEEALKYLVQTGKLVYQRSAWNGQGDVLDDLPDSLDSLLEARFCALDPELQEMLAKASLMGPEIEPELLNRMGNTNEGHLLDLMDKARKFGILDGAANWQDGGFRFNSKTARDVSYSHVPEEDRAAWHLQMADFQDLLAQIPGHLKMGPMLYHYQRAGQESHLREIQKKLTRVVPSPGITLPSSFSSKKKKGNIEQPVPLTAQGWGKILSIFHLLRAAVQTARLYPETSQAVSQSCERLRSGFEQVFQHSPSVNLSEADGNLLVNGEPPSWKGEEKTVADNFCKSLSTAGLKDISFIKGLDLKEIKEFLATWLLVINRSSDVPSAWEAFEQKEGMDHIQINAKVYVAVSDVDALTNGVNANVDEQSGQSIHELTDLISSIQTNLSELKNDSQNTGVDPNQASQFRSLLEKIQALVDSDSAETASKAVSRETVNEAIPSTSAAAGSADEFVVEKIDEHDTRCFLADILSGNPQREARGYRKISEKGDQSVDALYFVLTQSEDAHEGRVCARFLKTLCSDLAGRIRSDLERNADAAEKKRLIQYAVPVLESKDIKKIILLSALQQDESSVVMEALHQVETEFSEHASPLLLEALPLCNDRASQEICAVLGRLGDPASIPQLLEYLNQWKALKNGQATRFLESVCLALSHFDEPEVVNQLGALLGSCSKLPWRKVAPVSLRKASFKALERIGGETAFSLLKKRESDKDPWIRYRVKNFLGGQLSGATAGQGS